MDGQGKIVLITGGNRGLGFGAAQKLAQRGFRVLLTSRTLARAEEAAEQIRTKVSGAQVRGLALDLTSFAAVRSFVEQVKAEEKTLHLLIANAASLSREQEPHITADGYESIFQTNHLGHFLLVTQLLPLLEAGAQAAGEVRVVVISSRLHLPKSMGKEVRFDFDNLDLARDYEPVVAYKNSKLANMWFTYELNRRLQGRGITVNALCPGFVPATAAVGAKGWSRFMLKYILPRMPFANSLDDATDTYLYVATDPALKGVGGKFYGEKTEIASSPESYDQAKAARLWQISEEITAAYRVQPTLAAG